MVFQRLDVARRAFATASRHADEGKLAAYFGIVPRVSRSNETEHTGRITGKQTGADGVGAMRADRATVQPISEAVLRRDQDTPGNRQAIIALARKLLDRRGSRLRVCRPSETRSKHEGSYLRLRFVTDQGTETLINLEIRAQLTIMR